MPMGQQATAKDLLEVQRVCLREWRGDLDSACRGRFHVLPLVSHVCSAEDALFERSNVGRP